MDKTFTFEVTLSPAEISAVHLYALHELGGVDANGKLTSASFETALHNIFLDRLNEVRLRMLGETSRADLANLFGASLAQPVFDNVFAVGRDQFSSAYRVGFLQCLNARLEGVELFCPYQERVEDFQGLRDGLTKAEHERNYRDFQAGVEEAKFFSVVGVDPLWLATSYKELRQNGNSDKDAKEYALQNWYEQTSAD